MDIIKKITVWNWLWLVVGSVLAYFSWSGKSDSDKYCDPLSKYYNISSLKSDQFVCTGNSVYIYIGIFLSSLILVITLFKIIKKLIKKDNTKNPKLQQ